MLDTIIGAPGVQDSDVGRCNRLLANLLRESPRYNNALIIALDGHLPCAATMADPSVSGADRDYFKTALKSDDFAIGEYTIGRSSGLPAIHIAKRVKNTEGTVVGVAVLALDINWLGEQVSHLQLPAGAAVTITDRNGTILVRSPGQAAYSGTQIPAKNRFILTGDEVGLAEMTSLDQGRPMMVAYSPPGADPKG